MIRLINAMKLGFWFAQPLCAWHSVFPGHAIPCLVSLFSYLVECSWQNEQNNKQFVNILKIRWMDIGKCWKTQQHSTYYMKAIWYTACNISIHESCCCRRFSLTLLEENFMHRSTLDTRQCMLHFDNNAFKTFDRNRSFYERKHHHCVLYNDHEIN